ncbi:hypothetical protein RFI_10609 [Reticulomyxa filosa]|uniref:PH domain-containing protein n=1 Tax=Reticulomyxa filosa TaxID=46433 RepID=X6NLE2_RETFI|nr:hypothetical protein RFI_10609 [Reticulomyxa filosa]|eukprot:ETO26529.1 hypothetical protein RFI_10609 [Reticulomyxa filosa]
MSKQLEVTSASTNLVVKEMTPLSLSLDILSCLDELIDTEAWVGSLEFDEEKKTKQNKKKSRKMNKQTSKQKLEEEETPVEEDEDEDELEKSTSGGPEPNAMPRWVASISNVKDKPTKEKKEQESKSGNNEKQTLSPLPSLIETIQSIDLVETRKKLNSISEANPNAHLLVNLDLDERDDKKTQLEFNTARQQVLKLPQLSGWVTKKSGGKIGRWQKRWLVVRPTHLLWSKKVEEIDNPLDVKERRKFQNCVPLLQVNEVKKVNSTKGRKFSVVTVARVYAFRAPSKEERDQWVAGLNAHLQALQHTMTFLAGNGLHFKNK